MELKELWKTRKTGRAAGNQRDDGRGSAGREASSRNVSADELGLDSGSQADPAKKREASVFSQLDPDPDPGQEPNRGKTDVGDRERRQAAPLRGGAYQGSGGSRRKAGSDRRIQQAETGSAGKRICLEIIIDGTLSFTSVYPKVYYILQQFLQSLAEKKRDYKGVTMAYGLTVIREQPETVRFANGTSFTESEQELLGVLADMEFRGGNPDGLEELNQALNDSLQELNNTPDAGESYKGLLMLTDSLPADGDTMPDFSSNEPGRYGDYTNYGLRFADFYAYSVDYMPRMRIVDRNGKLTENGRNTCTYHSLQALLEQETEDTVRQVQGMITVILGQASVR